MSSARTPQPYVLIDEVLVPWRDRLGTDLSGYRNHAQRVAHLCLRQLPDAGGETDSRGARAVLIAAAFHDLGIWSDRTWDYLEPSVARARAYLKETGACECEGEVVAMIREHHKLRGYHGPHAGRVEAFRKADWADVTFGLVGLGAMRSCGVTRADYSGLLRAFPDAGFHWRLVELFVTKGLRTPLRPLPMFRW